LWPMTARPWARPLAAALAALAVGLGAWMLVDQRDACRELEVGEVQLERIPGQPEFDDEYAQLLEWMRERHAAADDEPPYRATVIAPRNLHWFMDAPALTGMPIYKQGFTPGDNFVHKPEAGTAALLDALRVRYVITTGRRSSRGAREVASFGRIRVLERERWAELPIAWLRGPGTLEVLEDDAEHGVVRVRITGAGEGTRVVFGVAGFPRWTLRHDGAELEWIEVPVVSDGPAATQAERRGGDLRGGKAHGDDGSEPTLIAADVGDGELELRYRPRRAADVGAGLLSLLALLAIGALAWRPDRWPSPGRRLDAAVRRLSVVGHPAVIVGLTVVLVVGAAMRRSAADALESTQAVGWLEDGRAQPGPHVHVGPFKTDMLIVPAVLVDPRRKGPAVVGFPGVVLPERLHGWVAIDDDAAKLQRKGRHRVRIEARAPDGSATTLFESWLAHRPGRVPLAIDTGALAGQRVELRVVVESEGQRPPPLGLDLELGGAP
ncbi:MAG: hypothetical protein KC501_05890, partial [Myxococcales bacterium]|nr:hypothetical protein [Myxococcales bacterium]